MSPKGLGHRIQLLARILTVAYTVYLTMAALGPAPTGPEIPHLDKIMHALAWGGLAFLAAIGWPQALRGPLLLAAAHGALIEVLQGTVVQGRSAELADFLADLLGAVLAIVVLGRLRGAWGQKGAEASDQP